MTEKDVYEIFVESFYQNWYGDMDWDEILDEIVDDCSDETWFDLLGKYPDSLYEDCYLFYETHKI